MAKIFNTKLNLFLTVSRDELGVYKSYTENGTEFSPREADSIVNGRFAKNLVIVKGGK